MVRGCPWSLLLSCVSLFAGSGCSIGVNPFHGTVMQMTLEVAPSQPGHHLELWARNQFDDLLRINGSFTDPVTQQTIYPFGLEVRDAITLEDPCMIDAHGNLLTSAAAYPTTVDMGGVPQTPAQQAQIVRNRIMQLVASNRGGLESATLQAILPFNWAQPPTVAANATAGERLAACKQYWTDPLAYTPNPAQVTAPLHGAVYGFVNYNTLHPPAGYDGLRMDSPVAMAGVRELWLTDETVPANATTNADFVDPKNRGPVVLDGVPDAGGRDVLHFDLVGSGGSGSAALLVYLDQDSLQY